MKKRKFLVFLIVVFAVFTLIFNEFSEKNAVTAGTDKISTKVVPCGNTIGIKIESDGVVVVGTMGISGDGEATKKFKKGDIITKVANVNVKTTEELKKALENKNGDEIEFEVEREGEIVKFSVKPTINPIDGTCIIGVWVRDSAAGIGTMTWYEPETGRYGALGHGITDVDTGNCYNVERGEIVGVSVTGAAKGEKGKPGLIKGEFLEYEGTIDINCENGIGGYVENPWMIPEAEAIEVALPDEVETGYAEILCCTDGSGIETFSAEIEKTLKGKICGSKNMIIHITDERLIEKTGGIVQGMSGSPILQNGKIVGAVTHVFINDPTRGYGIFIEKMLAETVKDY